MKTLRAKVLIDARPSAHKVAEVRDGDVIPIKNYPFASSVEIAQDNAGIFLFRYDIDGNFVGDTWHKTIEDAKQQAEYEYGIHESDWIERESIAP